MLGISSAISTKSKCLNHTHTYNVSIRQNHFKTLNNFLNLLKDINCLHPTLGKPNYALITLFKTLDGETVLDNPGILSTEARKELQVFECRLKVAFMHHVDP